MAAGGRGQMPIAGQKRSVQNFSQGDIDAVISTEIMAQLPNSSEKMSVGISLHRKFKKRRQQNVAMFARDFSKRDVASEHMRDF